MRHLLALCLFLGCADGRSVVSVTVESTAMLAGVDRAAVRVSNLTTGRAADPVLVPAPSATLPPPLTFALVFDASVRGTILVAVDLLEKNGSLLATGQRSIAVAPSNSYSLTISVDNGTADLAVSSDLAGADLAGADLAGADLAVAFDLAGADLAGADLSFADLTAAPVLTPVPVQRAANNADILFIVDDAAGAIQMQQQFRGGIASLADAIAAAATPASYHIGLVTHDIGAGPSGAPGCAAFPFNDAQLIGVGSVAEPSPACQPLGGALKYVDFNQTAGTSNLPAGETLHAALSCMAAVGASGCGFRHNLEAMHRALDGTVAQNAGFLRADAVLALVWLTVRDDCSGLPTTDVFQSAQTAKYGGETVYRCHFGVQCGTPPAIPPATTPVSGLSMCVGATGTNGGLFFDTSRYTDFLTKSTAGGGIKADPNDVIAATIAAPNNVSVVLATNGSGATSAYTPCSPYTLGSCETFFDHSCVGTFPDGGAVGADPPIRLHQVVSLVAHHFESSICDLDYSPTMVNVVNAIQGRFAPACLPGALKSPAAPNCVVSDVAPGPTQTPIPPCSASGPPCWRLQTNAACPPILDSIGQMERLSLVVDRGGGSPPPNTAPVAACELQ
jgi:hypothetical protein